MSIRARLKRLEAEAGPTRGINWNNFHARGPEEIVPDDSGIDWASLFVPVEITDPVEPFLRELAMALSQNGLRSSRSGYDPER